MQCLNFNEWISKNCHVDGLIIRHKMQMLYQNKNTISIPFAFIPYEIRMYKNIVIRRKITMLHIVIVQIGTSSSYNYLIFSITRLIVGNYVSRCQCPIFLYQNSSTTPKTWGRIVVADRTTPIHKQLKFPFPWQRISAMKYSR